MEELQVLLMVELAQELALIVGDLQTEMEVEELTELLTGVLPALVHNRVGQV